MFKKNRKIYGCGFRTVKRTREYNKQTIDLFLVAGLFIIILLLHFSLVFAQTVNPREELERTAKSAELPQQTNIVIIIGRIVRIFLGFAGLILVVMFIYGGFLWLTSEGDEEKIKKAKGLIQNAVIGLAIVVLSYALATFILDRLGWAGQGPASGPSPP